MRYALCVTRFAQLSSFAYRLLWLHHRNDHFLISPLKSKIAER
jgi:hypothetical protein